MKKLILSNRKNFLLSGIVGSGKSTLAQAAAEHLGWTYFDPEEALSQDQGREIFLLCKEYGNRRVRDWLKTLLVNQLNTSSHLVIPYPVLLTKLPAKDYQEFAQHGCIIHLSGMPMEIYARVVARELNDPSGDPSGTFHTESESQLRSSGAKAFFYHQYWSRNQERGCTHFRLRTQGNLQLDTQHLLKKIGAICAQHLE